MKVRELIAALKSYDENAEVIVQNDNWTRLQVELRELNSQPVLVVYSFDSED
jgi:hypothetical protein